MSQTPTISTETSTQRHACRLVYLKTTTSSFYWFLLTVIVVLTFQYARLHHLILLYGGAPDDGNEGRVALGVFPSLERVNMGSDETFFFQNTSQGIIFTQSDTVIINATIGKASNLNDWNDNENATQSIPRFLGFPTVTELHSSCPPRLEFLHIPKTGGTTIEKTAGIQHDIAWGACHFHLNFRRKESPWKMCPTVHLNTSEPLEYWPSHKTLSDLWHYPLHWLTRERTVAYHPIPSNPYNNLSGGNLPLRCQAKDQELHFFAVVRNPYSRAISEFYYQAGISFKKRPAKLTKKQFLNEWLYMRIKEYHQHEKNISKGWNPVTLHWIPQYNFIFDDSGNRQVRHILRFEHLNEEFSQLMSQYNLNISLPLSKTKTGTVPEESRLSVEDLTGKTRSLIESHFRMDFALGGYSMFGDNNTTKLNS